MRQRGAALDRAQRAVQLGNAGIDLQGGEAGQGSCRKDPQDQDHHNQFTQREAPLCVFDHHNVFTMNLLTRCPAGVLYV